MTPLQFSAVAWLGGGAVGAALSKKHRVAGFAFGAILVGAFADVVIEKYHPAYLPPSRAP